MDKRIAKRIACSLAADLLHAEVHTSQAVQGLGYSDEDRSKIFEALDTLIAELEMRGVNAPPDPAPPRRISDQQIIAGYGAMREILRIPPKD